MMDVPLMACAWAMINTTIRMKALAIDPQSFFEIFETLMNILNILRDDNYSLVAFMIRIDILLYIDAVLRHDCPSPFASCF